MGIVVSSRHGVFSKVQSQNLGEGLRTSAELPAIEVQREDPIFMAVDPTGGGASKLALVSFAVVKNVYITVSKMRPYIFSFQATPCEPSSLKQMRGHLLPARLLL